MFVITTRLLGLLESVFITIENGLYMFNDRYGNNKMPITTRSNSGPTKKMLPVKRPYEEISSDDDTDSEYYPQEIYDSMIDEIEELKNKLDTSKHAENALVDALVEEREKTRDLEAELNDWIEKYSVLHEKYEDSQNITYYTYLILLSVFIAGMSVPMFMCY